MGGLGGKRPIGTETYRGVCSGRPPMLHKYSGGTVLTVIDIDVFASVMHSKKPFSIAILQIHASLC